MITSLKLVLLSAVISWIVFHVFPPVWSMANNADSLILLDIAHDVLAGKSLYGWNFPRVLYIFPDLFIAFIVMAPGWFQDTTLITIATINYSLLTLVVHRLLLQLNLAKTPSIPATAVLIALALMLFAAVFPFSMSTIFWQIFASGAHFLSVLLVVLLFSVIPRDRLVQVRFLTGAWITPLVFLAALSNTMSALLISVMMLARWFWGQIDAIRTKQAIVLARPFEITIGLAVLGGVVLGAQVPRQSMANSFFSVDRFNYSIGIFYQWLTTSWVHVVFLVLILLLALYWAILSTPLQRARIYYLPNSWHQCFLVLRNPYLLPALAILIATPLFYQEITRSLRYLAFPGLLGILSLCVLQWVIFERFTKSKLHYALSISISFICLIILIAFNPDKTYISDDALPKSWIKQADLKSRLHPKNVTSCLNEAREKNGIKDGLALFWTARPARFASDFQFYFAQVSPWNARGGYAFWGANAMNILYADFNPTKERSYNYILASDSDLSGNYWGSILLQASEKINCGNYHIFVYPDSTLLSQFLFPWGVPIAIDGNGIETHSTQLLIPDEHGWVNKAIFPSLDLKTAVGKYDKGKIYTGDKEGFLVFGPYITLPAGHYELTVLGSLERSSGSIGVLDVVGDGGKKTVIKQNLMQLSSSEPLSKLASPSIVSQRTSEHSTEITKIQFTIDQPLREAEFRIYIPSETKGFVDKYILKRRPL